MTTIQELNEIPDIKQEWLTLARQKGLSLNPEPFEINESGLDFIVAFATDEKGQSWVLRKPRRPDVWERAENEYKVLQLVSKKLPIEVPDWRIYSPELIAYPLLKGNPVGTVDPAGGGYIWLFDQSSLGDEFFNTLASSLAALHNIDHTEAAQAGIRVHTPKESRETFARNIEKVKQSFTIPEKLYERWSAWLGTDSYWPEHSVLHHGDLHPPHILVDQAQRVTGFIDWTEAEVADPGKDFVILFALFGEVGLKDLLKRYERAGGRTWPRMNEHIAEQWAAYPAVVAQFALTTGKESDREMANAMIANWPVD